MGTIAENASIFKLSQHAFVEIYNLTTHDLITNLTNTHGDSVTIVMLLAPCCVMINVVWSMCAQYPSDSELEDRITKIIAEEDEEIVREHCYKLSLIHI